MGLLKADSYFALTSNKFFVVTGVSKTEFVPLRSFAICIVLSLLYCLKIGSIKLKQELNRILRVLVCVVVKNGHCCSLLEVTDRSRSTTSVTRLLQELEIKRVVGLAYF